MKKILIAVLMVGFIGLFAADNYAYKINKKRCFPIKIIPSEQAATYQAQGFMVEPDRLAMYNRLVAAGQEDVAIRFGIVPSFSEKFLALKNVSKLMAQRAMRAMTDAEGVYLEDKLIAFLAANPVAKRDWDAAQDVDLNDPGLQQALPALGIDPAAVKQKMLDLGIAK